MSSIKSDDEAPSDLLFFDTFSHEINELNLDLCQFTHAVKIREIRIIPLGAKVQADFPGGVRLGATNPSSFHIDFFVNDLSKPGAAAFERLGSFDYNQTTTINWDVLESVPSIPTDGLVLRGWYTTITLAVYGQVTKNIMEQIASPNMNVVSNEKPLESSSTLVDEVLEVTDGDTKSGFCASSLTVDFQTFFPIEEPPFLKDPRFHDGSDIPGPADERPRERTTRVTRRASIGPRSGNRRSFSRSPSPEDVFTKSSRNQRRLSRNSAFESRRDSSFSADDGRKRPRTPPLKESVSPISFNRHPRSPNHADGDMRSAFHKTEERFNAVNSPTSTPLESPAGLDEDMIAVEHYEPILSDEEIGDDLDQYELNYDFEEDEEQMRIFNPIELQRFESQVENKRLKYEFEVLVKILTKFKTHCSGSVVSLTSFAGMSGEDKESWVHSMEKMNQCLSHVYHFGKSTVETHLNSVLVDWKEVLLSWLMIGLDYGCAKSQTAYKIRHIKVGVRFAELFCCYNPVAYLLCTEERTDIFQRLFDLYDQEFMSVSIQVMILRSVFSALDTQPAVEYFLGYKADSSHNLYQRLLQALERNPKIYLKFALKAIVKKLNLYEALQMIKDSSEKLILDLSKADESELALLKSCLKELRDCYVGGELFLGSKHFVPVSPKIEINRDSASVRALGHTFNAYFSIHAFLESLLLWASNRSNLVQDVDRCVLDVLKAVTRNPFGFQFLAENIETTSLLVRCLVQTSSTEDWADTSNEWLQVGLEIAYKVQTKYYLDAIQNLNAEFDVADNLMGLFNLTLTYIGRPYVLETILMHDNLLVILTLIDREKQKLLCSTKYKSPILSYSVDILDCVVRHGLNVSSIQKHCDVILSLVKSYDVFESNVSAMLQELIIYLKPFESQKFILSYDDVTPLCDLIKRSFEFFTTFPGDLIMCLRIANYLATPEHFIDPHSTDDLNEFEGQSEFKELRFKMFVIQFYAADGYALLLSILDKMVTHFQQPKIHSSNLVGSQGVLVMEIIIPTLQVLRRVLNSLILTRNVDFRDTTAIRPLLQTFNLMHNIPSAALAFGDAQRAQAEIIKILLCYTKPKPIDGVDTDSVMRSLWTQVVGEVIKFTLDGPLSFITGLIIFSELLPLPLPILTPIELSDKEVGRILTERQLWSAHLHPQSHSITELIQTLSPSSYTQLSVLLTRVCLQLSDLGPNMSLVVAKSVVDLILGLQLAANGVASSYQYRLINFLANLTCYSSVKIALLSLMNGKLLDLYNSILTNSNNVQVVHVQTQVSILETFQNLLDCENTILATHIIKNNKELALSCAIPAPDHLNTIVSSCIDNFCLDTSISTLVAVRVLMIFTEHDSTIGILKHSLEKKKNKVLETLRKLVSGVRENNEDCKQILIAFLELLGLLIHIEPLSEIGELSTPVRTIKLNKAQMGYILNFWPEPPAPIETSTAAEAEVIQKLGIHIHPLIELRNLMAEPLDSNKAMAESSAHIVKFLETTDDVADSTASDAFAEVSLPQADGIVIQYTSRQIYTVTSALGDRKHLLERNYWLNSPNYDEEVVDMEQIPCDLTELARTCFTSDTNLISDCKRVLNLSVSPQANRERTVTAPCFRTRRVEVEPMTGRPEKKIYISSMRGRGYARTPPSRGDLFRSRPPNTSRPPSLHVDDFLALETCGAQPTGPTGYNKMSREIIGVRGGRGRGRGFDKNRIGSGGSYRSGSSWLTTQSSSTSSPGQTGKAHEQVSPHFRIATAEPVGHYSSEYGHSHFAGSSRGRFGRGYMRTRTFPR